MHPLQAGVDAPAERNLMLDRQRPSWSALAELRRGSGSRRARAARPAEVCRTWRTGRLNGWYGIADSGSFVTRAGRSGSSIAAPCRATSTSSTKGSGSASTRSRRRRDHALVTSAPTRCRRIPNGREVTAGLRRPPDHCVQRCRSKPRVAFAAIASTACYRPIPNR